MNLGDSFQANWTLNVTSSDIESYLVNVKFNSSYGNTLVPDNSTEDRLVLLNDAGGPSDAEYPTFSNYWDNNATLVDSGLGLFNTTLLSTNGTVLLEIDGNNYTATNGTNGDWTVYNATATLSSSGTYPYYWHSWGNGTSANYNQSLVKSYTVNSSSSCTYSSGDWVVNCADNCVISSNIDLGGNDFTLSGSGRFIMDANITNFGIGRIINGCTATCRTGCINY